MDEDGNKIEKVSEKEIDPRPEISEQGDRNEGESGDREGSKEISEGSEGEKNQRIVAVEMDNEKVYKEMHMSPPRTRART